jgi:hypothetical protein
VSEKKMNPIEAKIREKAARGVFDLIEPLDYWIIAALPDEGEMVLGAYPAGKSVVQLNKEIAEGRIGTSILTPRVKQLNFQGLVVGAKGIGTGGAKIWQATPKGRELYATWKEKQDAASTEG